MIQQRGNRWRVVVQVGRDPITGARRQLSGAADSTAPGSSPSGPWPLDVRRTA
jgi:hypothetical protein